MKRDLISGIDKVGSEVTVRGWVSRIRLMGKLIFLEIRDRSGVIQTVYEKSGSEDELFKTLKSFTQESVVSIEGIVQEKQSKNDTKEFEILVNNAILENKAAPLPIPVEGDGKDINEESRLKYRYLDLRRDRMNKNLRLRSKFIHTMREVLIEKDFVEVETPILTASTMEGARDFVVPSRLHPGKFYALPQSPQQYKQLLMTGGIEKYFQFARCIRDEDLRADRGFEFTQMDLEMSFAEEEDVMDTIQEIVVKSVKAVGGKLKDEVFPKFTYEEAMSQYGADKFDIRSEKEKEEGVLAFAWVHRFPFFKEVDREDVAEVRDGKSGWTFTHNPFSMPLPEHLDNHMKMENVGEIITQQYDLVCNGYEAGGGSIRAHKPEILRATYKIMGYSDEEIEKSIGHMLKAFEVGTPPHGGIALGIDRLVMILNKEESLKENVAFPMTYNGRTAVMEGPGPISEDQRKELGLDLAKKDGESISKAIRDLLDSNKFEYEYYEHEPTPTSEEAAKVRDTKLEEAAKALILKGKKSGKNIMVVIRGDKKFNSKEIKNAAGEEFEFEKPDVIKERFGLIIGGVPPFGNLLDLPIYFDESILESSRVTFSAGLQTCSITMNPEDLSKVTNAIEGSFSK